ncbi:MAG: GspE/PulE family protein [Nitrincola lacisaponensis]|uniref:MSHA biogenesis protein MshE n=1 Tax=Nitrincola lacisaponensis TaxID=267850 RepID=A0A063Y4M3_9GAMM|nr:GspE/PulE family protein [Nitrincola lacisaponensis]KDE40085.1 MSHA biogenesis protein MshE [Nitrincola lacisaponensis]
MTQTPQASPQSAPLRQKIRLGDLLVEKQVITPEQLDKALSEQKKTGTRLGRMLISLGFINEQGLLDFLAEQLKIPYVDLRHFQLRPASVKLLPETLARRFRAIVLEERPDGLLVGLADPTDIFIQDEISRLLKRPVSPAIVRESDVLNAFDTLYRRTDEISSIAEELGEELAESDFDLAQLARGADVTDAPVVRLLQSLFEDAVQVKASDIHIEPDEQVLRLRQRIDGVLQEQIMKEKRIAPALVSRLKLMGGLNISEKRMPQDGRFNIRVKDRAIDVRLSTMPTIYGESVVMRLLDQSQGVVSLDHTGMPAELVSRFKRVIHKPHGMVLVTGPTGSGKTTTLYAALTELNRAERKIITIEDPVEYRMPRINQVQVNFKIGLTFAGVLRTALRQDPDVILIGEMRDQETAEIGLRAAMTGHLVLSTLHTNDAVSTANRLIDMGAAGYLVATSLQAVLAQRLIRKVCDNCAHPHTPDANEQAWLSSNPQLRFKGQGFVKGQGCMQCNNTGYKGRVGIFEFLEIDTELADALRRSDTSEFHRLANTRPGFKTLGQSALDLAADGISTLEEVIRVAGESVMLEPQRQTE